MAGIDPYAYMQQVSAHMDSLSQRDAIERVLDEMEYLFEVIPPDSRTTYMCKPSRWSTTGTCIPSWSMTFGYKAARVQCRLQQANRPCLNCPGASPT